MNKEILRVALDKLRNNTHLELMHEQLVVLTQTTTPLPEKIAAQVRELAALVAQEDTAMLLVRKYETTGDIADLDKERDNLYLGMMSIQRAGQRDFDPVVKAAATRLQVLFAAAGNVTRMPYDEETTSIDKVLQELDLRAADAATVGLTRWIDELRKANGKLRILLAARYSEEAQRTHLVLQDVRRQASALYLDVIRLLEAVAALDEGDTYSELFAELNARVSHHKTLLAQAKGRRKAGSAAAL
jgi:hypothetical protein